MNELVLRMLILLKFNRQDPVKRTDGRICVLQKKTVELMISVCGGWGDTFYLALTAISKHLHILSFSGNFLP